MSPAPRIHCSERVVDESALDRDVEADARPSSAPLVLDLGSTSLRVGYADEADPRFGIEPIVSRYRERKGQGHRILAGGDCYADAASRGHIRSPFDAGLLVGSDQLELLLDSAFVRLGLEDDTLARPVYATELLCPPQHSHGIVAELLFECYGAPSVAFASDALGSLFANGGAGQDALVISSSAHHTTIIPVLAGRPLVAHTRRIAWGGAVAAEYLLRLLQLKYPGFPGRVTFAQAESIMHETCAFSLDYQEDVRRLADPQAIADADRVVQFPFVRPVVEEKTDEQIAAQAQRRRDATQRLIEQQAKMRLEKLSQREEEIERFTKLQAQRGVDDAAYAEGLAAEGFDTDAALDAALARHKKLLKRARDKDAGVVEEEQAPPSFPLVDVPDHTLDEEQLKEKRKQKLIKAGYDARMRMKAEREAERDRLAEEKRLDDELRTNDFQGWLDQLREQHEAILERMAERKSHKTQLGDRKSLAAQQRMKTISTLADDARQPKRRKKAAEDTFGAKDEDWAVYRQVGNADDSEEEEDDAGALAALEARLLEHDPDFSHEQTAVGRQRSRRILLNAFLRGTPPTEPGPTDEDIAADPELAAQLHINVERMRVPEALYQPGTAGVDQAGLLEVVENILRNFTAAERDRLTGNVFVAGGNSLTPNFDYRLQSSLRSVLPVGTPLSIRRAADVQLDAWRGLARWSSTAEGQTAPITRAQYDEFGADYLRDHTLYPLFVPTS